MPEATTENDAEREHYTLPEQRMRLTVRDGGRGVVHVVEYRTHPAWVHPGRWTRRAADRSAFCGSLRAAVIGVDAADWPTKRKRPENMSAVTCRRCLERAARVIPPEEPA